MYSDIFDIIYGFLCLFYVLWITSTLQMYLHVHVCVFLTCVQDANLIHD
jgi:hypothetical protein